MASYVTTFPANEDPIDESGRWVNGLATGLDWQNCRTSGGTCFPSSVAVFANDDCTALVNGTWTWNQTVTATAVKNDVSLGQETELRLNSIVTAHSNVGYEISIASGNSSYIVRWNGARGDYTVLDGPANLPGDGFMDTGDILKVQNVNGTISVYLNQGSGFVFIHSAVDTTYQAGMPGVGFILPAGSTTSDVGWSDFTAIDDAVGGGADHPLVLTSGSYPVMGQDIVTRVGAITKLRYYR